MIDGWAIAFFYLHHVCQGTHKGISLFALPNFNLYTIYMKKIHPLDMFILSLKARVSLAKQDWLWLIKLQYATSTWVVPMLISMCQEYFLNTWTHLTQFCCNRLTQAREWHILDHITTHRPSCWTPAKPERIIRLACELNVGRTRKSLWEERRGWKQGETHSRKD